MKLAEYYINTSAPIKQDPDLDVDGILEVRFSSQNDYQNIVDFYDDNPSEYLTKRKPEIIKERAEKGKVCLISINETYNKKPEIVHSSIRYDHNYDSDELVHVEFGTQIARDDMRGLDLGRKAAIFQTILGAFLYDKVQKYVFQDIYNSNEINLNIIRSEKGQRLFTEFPPDKRTINSFENTAEIVPPPRTFFKTSPEQIYGHALALNNLLNNPIIQQKGTGKKFLMVFPEIENNNQLRRFIEIMASPYVIQQDCLDNETYAECFNSIAKLVAGHENKITHENSKDELPDLIKLIKQKLSRTISNNIDNGNHPPYCLLRPAYTI